MKILTVCVNFDDFLRITLPNNLLVSGDITVVTTSTDEATKKVCDDLGVNTVISDRCFEDGDPFNKGKMINDGLQTFYNERYKGWVILTDADVMLDNRLTEKALLEIPPLFLASTNRVRIETQDDLGPLMVEERVDFSKIDPATIDEALGFGYFQGFHTTARKIYSEKFPGADQSDDDFRRKFPRIVKLDYPVISLGAAGGKNWRGRKTERWHG